MKVEKVLAIEGNHVTEVFQNRGVIVYQSSEEHQYSATLYFVNRSNDEVMFKQQIEADYCQNFGHISNIDFVGL